MTPEEVRAATRDGILDACGRLAQVAGAFFAVAACIRYPRLLLTFTAIGVLWGLFALADSKRPVPRFIGAVAWKGIAYVVLLGLIYLGARWLDPPFARLLADMPAQLWRNTTW